MADIQEIIRTACVAFGRCDAEARFELISAYTVGELGLIRGKVDHKLLSNTLKHNIERHDLNHKNAKVKLAAFRLDEDMTLDSLANVLASSQRPI